MVDPAQFLCNKAVDLHKYLGSDTSKAIDIQAELQQLAGNPELGDELRNNDSTDNLQDDLNALERAKVG